MADRKVRRSINAWDLCQRYVDLAPELGQYATLLSGWIRSRSLAKLATCSTLLDLHSLDIGDAPLLKHLLQVESFFKKNSDFSGPECEAKALENFLLAETKCRITNKRLDYYLSSRYRHRLDADVSLYVDRAQRVIARVLGNYRRDFLDNLPKYIRFSGGATATLSRKNSHPSRKIRRNCVCSQSALPYVKSLWSWFSLPGEVRPSTIEYNRVLFVPKNFKTARTIAGEPDGNMPLQLAFDSYAKTRLRLFGQDLSDQKRNQEDARIGSIDGSLSTIDFSMASDTVSLNALHGLFPRDFCTFLTDVRSHFGKLPDGRRIRYAKLSSMGNGATFAVETLCFFALAKAVGSTRCNVYGDDVTIETELVEPFVKLARFFGFIVNTDKSYSTGFLRESCGKYYCRGIDVTPHFLRSNCLRPANVSLLINGLSPHVNDGRFVSYLLDLIPDIRVVPINEDPTSGVFVSREFAERTGRLYTTKARSKFGPFVVCYKGYSRKSTSERNPRSLGSLWLWYLHTKNRPVASDEAFVTSSLTLSRQGSRTRELVWREPEGMLPDFTVLEEQLLARMG